MVAANVVSQTAPCCYRARLAVGETDVAGPPGLAMGDQCALLLRPESVSLAETGLPATVRSVAYQGASQQLTVALGADIVRLAVAPNLLISVGVAVHLRIANDAWLMRTNAA